MYGQGGGFVIGATTAGAGVAALPATGTSETLTFIAIAAIVLGSVAVVTQLAVAAYRRHALSQL